MPYSLIGRNVLVTGGSRGLGAKICAKFAAEGCNVSINYASDRSAAEALQKELQSARAGIKTLVVQGDCSVPADNARIVSETIGAFGGLDILIANAGWTRFATWDLNDLSLEEWNKCWAANVMAHLQLVQAAKSTFEANEEGGVYVITSSVAGVYTGGSSMGYSVTKAAGLHLMKCLAASQGSKLRINAVLPGLLLTEWGKKFGEERIKMLEEKTVLKTHTDLDDCADMYVTIAKNKSMTGQEILIDAGLKAGLK